MVNYFKSVVIPIYNGEKYIDRALRSIKNQTLKIDEVVIINDASRDSTEEQILKWQNQLPIIYLLNKKNLGAAKSLHIGVKKTSGDIIFHLDHDDEWLPNHIKNIINIFSCKPEIDLVSSKTSIIINNKETYMSKSLSDINIRSHMLWDNPIVHSSAAFKKTGYLRTYGYGYEKVAHDYRLWIQLLKNGNFGFSDEVSCKYYVIEQSLSRKNKNLSIKERIKIQWIALKLFGLNNPFISLKILPILLFRTLIHK